MTTTKKNLIIATLECSLANGKAAAGITTLTDIETTLAALRTAYTTDPATVREKDLWTCYAKFQRLQFPNVENLWWAFLDAPVFDINLELRTTWGDIVGKPAKFPPSDHTHPAQTVTWEDVQSKPTAFPPADHSHPAQTVTWEDVQSKPTAFPPAAHAHDLLQIGDMLLRYNSGGYLEQSTNAGATWTPLVSESAPPAVAAYALAWAESATERLTRNVVGAWINGDLQVWMRVYLDAASQGTYWLTTEHFQLQYGYTGAIGVCYINRYGDWNTAEDARTGITGWHDIGLQWTPVTGSAIIYLDGVGDSPLSVSNVALDDATQYAISLGNARYKIASLKWSHALTWTASAASAETMTDIILDLPLSEGSGATTTDSTGTAWTIPAGVTWEAY